MRTMTDIQRRILKEEYPTLSFDSDSDIERYFELRKQGRQADALAIYNNRLRKKYPNDARREELLRYYRSRDPRYAEMLYESTVNLAERLVTRTTYVISLLTKDIDTVDMTDAYSVIKLAEGLLSVISPDRYIAISFTEKYVRYARALSFRQAEMERTAELIRLYVTDTIESIQDLKKEREERRKLRARQAERQRHTHNPGFDLSKIVFSAEDLARIQIPAGITKTEDVVIAYCLKYWNLTGDPAFEKAIFLYSRKYGTKHHDIFQAIKNGRDHGWKDEEILNAVLANVVTGYYYSISGDVYLQRAWARYKVSVELGAPAVPPIAQAPMNTNTGSLSEKTQKQKIVSKQTKLPARRTSGHEADKSVRLATSTPTKTPKPTPIKAKARIYAPGTRETTAPARIAKANSETVSRNARPGSRNAPRRVTPFKPEVSPGKTRKLKLPPAPSVKPNSVADMIRAMTGKTYTVYKDLFFREIRPSIRAVLASSKSRRGNPFGNRQNDAEEIMYDFLHAHYDDPYQNWKDSEERKAIEELGYAIPALEPVIAGWVKDKA